MKFVLILAVLVAASFAAPNLPTTFTADIKVKDIFTSAQTKVVTGTGTLAEDNDNHKKLECLKPDGKTESGCKLTDFDAKKLYLYGKGSDGKLLNCTSHTLSGNASKYRDDWVWLPESKDEGSGSIAFCGVSGEVWELKFLTKLDAKLIPSPDGKKPLASDSILRNSTGSLERIRCYTTFSTTIDPKEFVAPVPCTPGLTITEEEDILFRFYGMF